MIFDKDSELKVKVTNDRIQEIGNDEVHDYKVFMNVNKLGFFHESKIQKGREIKSHSHQGDILNFVMDGSMTINGKTYNKGDWYMIPEGTQYSGVVNEDVIALMFCSFASTKEPGSVHIEAWVLPRR
jgi:quercetin dioxygenase-like cupin family protein